MGRCIEILAIALDNTVIKHKILLENGARRANVLRIIADPCSFPFIRTLHNRVQYLSSWSYLLRLVSIMNFIPLPRLLLRSMFSALCFAALLFLTVPARADVAPPSKPPGANPA